jgi:HSP20 family protein
MKESNNYSSNNQELQNKNKSVASKCCGCLQKIKPCLSSKGFVAIIFFIVGAGGVLLAQNIMQSRADNLAEKQLTDLRDWYNQHQGAISIKDDPLFGDKGMFAEMDNMKKKINQAFQAHQKHMVDVMKEAQKNGANVSKTSVSNREDDQNYYYQLNFSGFKKEDVAVEIKDNVLTFSAKNEQENDDKKQKFSSASSFKYSFSVPEYNTKKEPEIVRENDKITVKFAKKESVATKENKEEVKK